MSSKLIKISAKGSRKTGQEFKEEIAYLSTLTDCIEIDFNYPHDSNFDDEINFLIDFKKQKSLNYTVHAQYLNGGLNDFNQTIREETIKTIFHAIDNAEKIGAKIVVVHPALEPYGWKIEKRIELEIDSYRRIADYAAKKNIRIGLENEAKTCFWFPDRATKFELISQTIKAVDRDNFGLTIDIGHANVTGEDYISAIKLNANKLYHIHAHDNLGSPENNQKEFNRPDPHLAPGKGTINWKLVIKALVEINYDGYFELEIEPNEMENGIKLIRELNEN